MNLLRVILLFSYGMSWFSNAEFIMGQGIITPDQNISVHIKYDQETQEFYDIIYSGSVTFFEEPTIVSNNELKIKHGRDGYVNIRVPFNDLWYRAYRNTAIEPSTLTLSSVLSSEVVTVNTGRGIATGFFPPANSFYPLGDSNNCQQTAIPLTSFSNMIVTTGVLGSIYDSQGCVGNDFRQSHYFSEFVFPSNVRDVGYTERYFKFNLDELNRTSFGEYSGVYSAHPYADAYRFQSHWYGREKYIYTVTLEVRPSVNSMAIDNDDVSFSVNKQSSNIKGKAQTGFTVRGSFLNSQAFDMTFNSANSALCSGSLCLSNTSTGTTIPYTTSVFDPATLQEKPVSRNGQKVTIYADQDYRLSGGLFFEFDTENTAVSGTFNDILTVKVELKLI